MVELLKEKGIKLLDVVLGNDFGSQLPSSKFETCILLGIILRDFAQANKNIRDLKTRNVSNSYFYYFSSTQ